MKTKPILLSAILFPALAFAGCTITVGPQNETPPQVTISPSSEAETPVGISEEILEEMSVSLPPLPALPTGQPDIALLEDTPTHPAFQIDQAVIELPQPPSVSDSSQPAVIPVLPAIQIEQALNILPPPPPPPIVMNPSDQESELNQMLSVLPAPPATPLLTPDSDIATTFSSEPVQAWGEEPSINYVNSYQEEALPAGPPPVPAVPSSN